MKEIPIEYINIEEKIKNIRESQSDEAIGRYMEKYEAGNSKPILLKEINRKEYILIDGHHRIEAIRRLKRRKIEADIIDIEDKEIYSKAVEENLKHGISLTKDEEEQILINLIEDGKTQEEVAKVFNINQPAIAKRIKKIKNLDLFLRNKIKLSTINELLSGKQGVEVAKLYDITKGRVSQIWGDWKNEIEQSYDSGITKQEILQTQQEKKINLTTEKLNELIEEDYNKLIKGDCLKELPKLPNEIIDCVIIDPPYGIDYQSNYRKEKHDKIKGDSNEAFNLLDKSLSLIKDKMKKNSHIYIFTSWKVFDKVKPIVDKYFDVKNCLIWNKNNWTAGDLKNNYAEKYEMIIFATQGKRPLYSEIRPLNVLDYARENTDEHPTRKPVSLLKFLISQSTKEGELVLDYFAGSGSTLEAAKETKRRWLGVEVK